MEEELKKVCEEIKAWKWLLKRKIKSEDFKNYEKLKVERKIWRGRCFETEEFDNVL